MNCEDKKLISAQTNESQIIIIKNPKNLKRLFRVKPKCQNDGAINLVYIIV